MDVREPATAARRRHVVAALVASTAALLCLATQWHLDHNRRVDFRIYYRAVESMSDGHLYDYGSKALNFLYPPVAAVLMAPLTWLSEDTASRVWLVATVLLGLGGYITILSESMGSRVPRSAAPAIAGLLLWSAPALLSFRQGQVNPVIGSLACVDAVLIARRHRAGGVALGLAAAIKVTPLLLIPVLAVCGRRADARRALLTFVVLSCVVALSWPSETWRYWTDVVFEASDVGGIGSPLNASLLSLTGLITENSTVQRALWAVGAAALAAVALTRCRRLHDAGDVIGVVVIATIATYLVSPVTWVHHQWLLPVAAVLWIDRSSGRSSIAVSVLGVLVTFDPLALGETSMSRTALMVAFGFLTVTSLPAASRSSTRTDKGTWTNTRSASPTALVSS